MDGMSGDGGAIGAIVIAELSRALVRAAPVGVRVAARCIGKGDEALLLPEERASIRSCLEARRRASAAARLAARSIASDLGVDRCVLVRSPSGAPRFPPSLVGSLAHDEEIAVAAVARADEVASVGIDVEPRAPLPTEMLDVVATRRELDWLQGDAVGARLLFCAKEAIFKCWNVLDGSSLDMHDVELDRTFVATVHGRCAVEVACVRAPRLVAIVAIDRRRSYRTRCAAVAS